MRTEQICLSSFAKRVCVWTTMETEEKRKQNVNLDDSWSFLKDDEPFPTFFSKLHNYYMPHFSSTFIVCLLACPSLVSPCLLVHFYFVRRHHSIREHYDYMFKTQNIWQTLNYAITQVLHYRSNITTTAPVQDTIDRLSLASEWAPVRWQKESKRAYEIAQHKLLWVRRKTENLFAAVFFDFVLLYFLLNASALILDNFYFFGRSYARCLTAFSFVCVFVSPCTSSWNPYIRMAALAQFGSIIRYTHIQFWGAIILVYIG